MKLLDVQRIWDKSPHNAFTDLIFFENKWFCTFRESMGHMQYDGKIRVISSLDGEKWESSALLEIEGKDLRDPKLSITPKNELMINAGIRLEEPIDGSTLNSITYFSKDGKQWSAQTLCETGKKSWRWSTTWYKGNAYSFAYGGKERQGTLYSSVDGRKWTTVKENVYPKAEEVGNEASILFLNNDKAYCLLRRNKKSFSTLLGVSNPPYHKWSWKNLHVPIGGPKMIRISDKRFLAVVRVYDRPMRTTICWVYPRSGQIKEALSLPSRGDSSYAGMVYKQGILWISYYSSHEAKSSIYLAKVKI